jgi:hypothetical protein
LIGQRRTWAIQENGEATCSLWNRGVERSILWMELVWSSFILFNREKPLARP